MKYTKEELCERIQYIHPDMAAHDIQVDVNWDKERNRWRVDMQKGDNRISAWLDETGADMCMENKMCAGLLAEITELKAAAESGSSSS
ncbi:MAG: hypothetical protein SWH68_14345 [Thermodesulfobacteriota bacterium]|nr:hypothetical protein [Thermodesulfobacteriota bacterium]